MLHCIMIMVRHPQAQRFSAERLFRPRSIAVLGPETPVGHRILANLAAGTFAGPIWPVGPAPSYCGRQAFPTLAALPGPADLAIVALAPDEIAPALAELGGRGTFATIVPGVVTGLAEAARAAGVRVLGPGSFGIAVPEIGLNATQSHLAPRPGRVALAAQSAALARAVLDWAEPNGIGFSHIVGIGGNANIGFGLTLDWLARDPGTSLILLDIRRIRNRRAFLSAARAAARLRPVVALREGGRLADPSGRAEATVDAALRRAGILPVSGFEDLLAAAETLTRARPVRGERLAIVTNAIGPGHMAADAALRSGLTLAEPDAAVRGALHLALPAEFSGGQAGGPVYVGLEAPTRLSEAAAILAAGPGVDGVLAVHAPTGPSDDAGIAALAAAAQTIKVPLLVCAMGETTGAAHRQRLAEAGIAVFAAPEQAVAGFVHLVQHRRNRAAARELPPRSVLQITPDHAQVAALFAQARAAGRRSLLQDEAMAVLAAYGVPIVPTRAVLAAEDAPVAASMLGYPVVLKLRRATRSGPGQVRLSLRDAASVAAAAAGLAGEGTNGLIVQRQVGRAYQVQIRVQEDAMFGPAIGFGFGGSAGEVMPELAIDLPPLNLSLAHALMGRTRVARLLAARNDAPAANAGAVAETLVRVSQLIVDFPEIADLSIDPLFVDTDGVLAGDATIELRAAGERGYLAIPPYPAELAEHWSGGGETLLIRPIRPEDAEAHGAFFKRLEPEDVRYRFFSPMRELSAEMMARLTQVDYEREMAFVAVREAAGETVGVARLVREINETEAEFAVIVQPDMKGRGLAGRLMQRLFAWARSQGITEIIGQVLADNGPMLAFVRHLGFTVRRAPGEEDVMEARLSL